MKKILLSIALMVTVANVHADVVLKAPSIKVCPKELTTSGKTITYTADDDKITVYTPDFLVDRTFTLPQNRASHGSYTEKGNVKVTGAKFKFDDYKIFYDGSFVKTDITATTRKELLEYLTTNYGSGYSAFTDPLGNPGCFLSYHSEYESSYDNCYLRELFGTKYPKSWYAIVDGSVYYYSYSDYYYPYDLTYNESSAEWTRYNEQVYSGLYIEDYDFAIDGKYISEDIILTQNVFNNDDKWEFIMQEYGPVEYHIIDEQIGNVQEDETVEVTRTVNYSSQTTGTAVYNEDGEKLCSFDVDYINAIHVINGKTYVLGYYSVVNETNRVLFEINNLGDDIDAIKKVEVKGESRLGAERGIVMVDIKAEQVGGEVVVSTADGKVMASKQVNAGPSRINETPLPTGVYIVSLMKDGKIIESEKYLVP